MEKRFEPAKDIIFKVLYFALPALLLITFLIDLTQRWQDSNPMRYANVSLIVIALLFVLLIWHNWYVFQKAYYQIKDHQLNYHFGWSKGYVPIQDIHSISYTTIPAVGKRPALHFKGLKINYGAGYSLFIAPQNHTDFIQSILAANPDIKITRSK